MSDQLEMEFRLPTPEEYREAQIEAQWRKNEAEQAAYWTEERRATVWAFGHTDVATFHGLKNYEQRELLNMWRGEWERPGRMRTFSEVIAANDAEEAQEVAIATRWAAEIRQAFAERKPCPFRPAEHATPIELLRFRGLLERAINIAQIPVECLAPDLEEK